MAEQITGILQIATQWGIFAALFIILLLYTIKQNDKRETAYQAVIKEAQQLNKELSEKVYSKSCDNGRVANEVSVEVDIISGKLSNIDHKIDKLDVKVDNLSAKVQTIVD